MPRQHLDVIRVRQLKLLMLIEATGSIGAAARQLHLTQPAVSQMLRELESTLGVNLALRNPKGAQLTDAARAALRRFGVALREIEAAAAGLAADDRVVVLRIGTMPLAALEWLPLTIAALRARGEPTHLRIQEGSVDALRKALNDGEVDCIISRLDPDRSSVGAGLVHSPLAPDALVVACRRGHPVMQGSATLDQLGACSWVLPPPDLYTRQKLDHWFLVSGATPPQPTIETGSFHLSLRIAAESDLLAVAPRTPFEIYRRLLPLDELAPLQLGSTDMMALIHRRSVEDLPGFSAFRAQLLAVTGAPGRPDCDRATSVPAR